MNFWYAQAQAQTQTQTGQAQYLVLLVATFAQPIVPQQGQRIKLSKLVKEVRHLGCETFSGLIDAIMEKN